MLTIWWFSIIILRININFVTVIAIQSCRPIGKIIVFLIHMNLVTFIKINFKLPFISPYYQFVQFFSIHQSNLLAHKIKRNKHAVKKRSNKKKSRKEKFPLTIAIGLDLNSSFQKANNIYIIQFIF